ncbi:R3H and coiled-coil domain-containing protein 1-like [Xenia sp. Carnegie-2017]|uniref:R3H and coiled-coil domain-containing protein 1-like n=1 Tax=Xenia sp. Carnegie-2017 TaxID=2897299 RepID=UPI001F037FEE|nr:R3H and coiled-coil domain-containing protein 1-like [Xenia sp. Carnegie-2017]
MITSLGIYLHDINEERFVEFIEKELSYFGKQRSSNAVLLFPSLSARYRFLIHKIVDKFSAFESYSIGSDPWRRPVVYFRAKQSPASMNSSEGTQQDCRQFLLQSGGRGEKEEGESGSSPSNQRPTQALYTPGAFRKQRKNVKDSSSKSAFGDGISRADKTTEHIGDDVLGKKTKHAGIDQKTEHAVDDDIKSFEIIEEKNKTLGPVKNDKIKLDKDTLANISKVEGDVLEASDERLRTNASNEIEEERKIEEERNIEATIDNKTDNESKDEQKNGFDVHKNNVNVDKNFDEMKCSIDKDESLETCDKASQLDVSENELIPQKNENIHDDDDDYKLLVNECRSTAKTKRQQKKEGKLKKKQGKLKKKQSKLKKEEKYATISNDVSNVDDEALNERKNELPSYDRTKESLDNTRDDDVNDKDGSDEEDWDRVWNEDGECLDKEMLAELNKQIDTTDVEIIPTQFDYLSFKPNDVILEEDVFDHVLEIYDFSPELETHHLMNALSNLQKQEVSIKWVDDTHALAVFSSSATALQALNQFVNPLLKLRPLHHGTEQSKRKARRNTEFLRPYKERPKTTNLVANRLVTGALGMKTKMTKEERHLEREKIKFERDKKINKEKQRRDLWERDDI